MDFSLPTEEKDTLKKENGEGGKRLLRKSYFTACYFLFSVMSTASVLQNWTWEGLCCVAQNIFGVFVFSSPHSEWVREEEREREREKVYVRLQWWLLKKQWDWHHHVEPKTVSKFKFKKKPEQLAFFLFSLWSSRTSQLVTSALTACFVCLPPPG